jgi:hypothetical protein
VSPEAATPRGAATGRVHALFDRLATAYSEGAHLEEIATAREDFFSRAGKVFEDDAELFEARLAAFLEWYVTERPLAGGPSPVLRALQDAGRWSEEDRRALAFIAASHRSIFDITAVEGRTIYVEDLLGGARFSVLERRSTVGFAEGDLLEARILWDGDEVIFGKTFLFHPRDAREQVLALVDLLATKGTTQEEILFTLSRLHVRWHRLGHVGAARIYREGLLR